MASEQTVSSYLPRRRGKLQQKLSSWYFGLAYAKWIKVIKLHLMETEAPDKHPRVLDVGCGPGNFICCCVRAFPQSQITGLDAAAELLEYSRTRVPNAHLIQGDAEHLPFGEARFDVLAALQVIEHLYHPGRFIEESWRVLAPEGILLLATPNPAGLAARLLKDHWQGYREDHVSLKPPREWRQCLLDAGFKIHNEGTTLFNGFPVLGRFPLGLPFQVVQALFGWFPWPLGESYMAIAIKKGQ